MTLTVTPDEGYAVGTVSYNDGSDHTVTADSTGAYKFTMPDGSVTVSASFTMTWASLNTALQSGGTFTLTNDATAASTDGALVVPSGKTVTLDLNGHTLNRHLTEATSDGSVLVVYGTLTLNDSSASGDGVITGGNSSGDGGGVYVTDTFTLSGTGAVSNNTAAFSGYGGGVFVEDDSNSVFQISGNPVITGNIKDGQSSPSNLHLSNGKKITVAGTMTAGASIGVTMKAGSGVFTEGLSGEGSLSDFSSDSAAYELYLSDGEAALAPVFGTPSFTLPAAIKTVGESAFEGLPMTITEIPDGCENVFIYGASGSEAEIFCSTHTNCTFVAESTDA